MMGITDFCSRSREISRYTLCALILALPVMLTPRAGAEKAVSTADADSQTLRVAIEQPTEYYKRAKFREALFHLRRSQKAFPDNEEIKTLIQLASGQLAYQQKLAQKVDWSRIDQRKWLAQHYRQAQQDYSAGRIEDARKRFQDVWALGGQYKDTWKYIQLIYKQDAKSATPPASKNTVAAPLLAVATTAGPQEKAPAKPDAKANAKARAKADAKARAKAAAEAKAQAKKKEKADEAELDKMLRQAATLAKQDKWAEAQAQYEKALELDTKNRPALKGVARARKEQDKAAELLAKQKRAAQEQAADNQVRKQQAKINGLLAVAAKHAKDGQLEEAAKQYQAVLTLEAKNKKALAGARNMKQQIEERTKAQEEKARANELARQREELKRQGRARRLAIAAAYDKATELYKSKNYTSALQAYDATLKLDPKHSGARKYRAKAQTAQVRQDKELKLAQARQLQEQQAAQEQARRDKSERERQAREQAIAADYNKLKELYKADKFTEALELSRSLLQRDRKHSGALKYQGKAQVALKRQQDQRQAAERAAAKKAEAEKQRQAKLARKLEEQRQIEQAEKQRLAQLAEEKKQAAAAKQAERVAGQKAKELAAAKKAEAERARQAEAVRKLEEQRQAEQAEEQRLAQLAEKKKQAAAAKKAEAKKARELAATQKAEAKKAKDLAATKKVEELAA
ncbi:hypothetical protein ACFL34_05090, partial [Candidatus Sumerlaeota bacterium]